MLKKSAFISFLMGVFLASDGFIAGGAIEASNPTRRDQISLLVASNNTNPFINFSNKDIFDPRRAGKYDGHISNHTNDDTSLLTHGRGPQLVSLIQKNGNFPRSAMSSLATQSPSTEYIRVSDAVRLISLENGPGNVAPLPVPASVYLTGAGVIGLVGLARRKSYSS